ncbi:MAG: serine hydrolase [Hydrogenophaga sp.]|nr:serine hydrolase [Hydrogenophaga sp.]
MRRWKLALLVAAACTSAQGRPISSPDGPDAIAYGQAQGYPVPAPGTPSQALRQADYVGLHSRYDQFRALHEVPTSSAPSALESDDQALDVEYVFEGARHNLDSYLKRHPVTGLLIAQDETIVVERYQYGRNERDRFLSHSMAKTITGLLVGAAVDDGAIRSLMDTAATYVPELAGTAYGETTIKDLLSMASGVGFRETYQPDDDIAHLVAALMRPDGAGAVEALRQFNQRVAEPGTVFSYASADSEVLGLVVSRATKEPLATYFSRRLWAPLGAEAPAAWDEDAKGDAMGFCCVVARLRDWARLGLMLAHDGRWNGRQVVSRQWLTSATTASAVNASYGYQIWLSGGASPYYALRGVLGQFVLIDPVARLVLVQTAVNMRPVDGGAEAELLALWDALRQQQSLTADWRRR